MGESQEVFRINLFWRNVGGLKHVAEGFRRHEVYFAQDGNFLFLCFFFYLLSFIFFLFSFSFLFLFINFLFSFQRNRETSYFFNMTQTEVKSKSTWTKAGESKKMEEKNLLFSLLSGSFSYTKSH